MNRITFPMLMLGLSLAPVLCWAAEPQPKASDDINVRYAIAAADVAKAEYEVNKKANEAVPGSVPKYRLNELTLKCKMADLAVEEARCIAAQLKAAQGERVKVLTELVEAVAAEFQSGAANIAQVVAAENELFNAVLTSTDDPETRIVLLTKQFERATNLFKKTQALHDAGAVGGSQSDLLRAKSLYLGVKIKLLQERSRTRPPTPTAQVADTAPEKPVLNFEYLSHQISRAKVEGGWLVMAAGGTALSIAFYPDPKHVWNGGNMK